jgi:hypothetical protein
MLHLSTELGMLQHTRDSDGYRSYPQVAYGLRAKDLR